MEQLSPEGLAEVVRDLVISDLWLNDQNDRYGHTQLQDLVLDLSYIQDLQDDHACVMMYVLAQLGHTVTPVLCKVHSAGNMSNEQVVILMRLAMRNGEPIDMGNLASCPAAADLEAEFVLEVGWLLFGFLYS
jgi:hypothetical protein